MNKQDQAVNALLMDARAQGFREALWEVKEILTSLDEPDVKRKALSEVDALLADAVSE